MDEIQGRNCVSGVGAEAAAAAVNDVDLLALGAKASIAAKAEAAQVGEDIRVMVEVATVLAETEKFNPTCEQHPCEMIDSDCL